MGQKIHPGGLRVGVIHDWKSNWYTSAKEFKGALLEDIKIREHINRKLGHAGLSDILIRKDKQRITIDIYTARPGIVIGKSGVEVDALRKRRARDDAQERAHQHQRDQASGAGREARRPVDRRAAPEPRQLPARDEALARLCDALRRPRREDQVRRPSRRRRDEPRRELFGGPCPTAHDPRRHRLRRLRGEDDLRPDRRQGLDQQGRDHAGGLRGLHAEATRGWATRTRPGGEAAPRRGSPPPARAAAAARPIARASARFAGVAAPAAADQVARGAAGGGAVEAAGRRARLRLPAPTRPRRSLR